MLKQYTVWSLGAVVLVAFNCTCDPVKDWMLPVGVADSIGRAAADHLLDQLLCLCQLKILLSALDRTQLIVPRILIVHETTCMSHFAFSDLKHDAHTLSS